MVDNVSGPVYAEFYEREPRMIYYEQTLTHDGEIRLIRVEREGVHDEAPLQVQAIEPPQEREPHAA